MTGLTPVDRIRRRNRSDAAMVAKVRGIVETSGGRIATAAEARAILGLADAGREQAA